MDISSDNYDKIGSYIDFSLDNNDYEFECLYKNTLKKLNLENFTKVFQYFQNNNNFILEDDKQSLDIRISSTRSNKFSNYRITIPEKDILNYCKTNKFNEKNADYGEKRYVNRNLGRYDPFVLDNYDFLKFTLKYDTFIDDHDIIKTLTPGSEGSTFGGYPLASVVGVYAVKTIIDQNLAHNARIRGAQLMQHYI